MPAVHQPRDLQVHPKNSHLWFKSSPAHRYQEVKVLKDLLPTLLFRLSFRMLRQAKERGGICSDNKLTSSGWWYVSKQLNVLFGTSTSFNPSSSIRLSRSSRSPSSVQKMDHPERFRHSDILNLPLSRKLPSPSIQAPATDHSQFPSSVMQPDFLSRS